MIVSFFIFEKGSNDNLLGSWKLIELEVNGIIVYPEIKEYFLTIEEERISYNLDINRCWVDSFSIDNERINYSMVATTKACCDGRFDTISNYLNYSGTYNLQDSVLTIDNGKGILRLTKY